MRAIPLIVLSMIASPAAAEVVSSSANGFHVRETVQMVVPTDRAYAAFSRLPEWWNKEHTYSGDSANLSLALTAGGVAIGLYAPSFAQQGPGGGAAAGSAAFPARNERSIVSFGSTETGWSRQSQRIISGSIAPPMSWLWTPMPQA